MSPAPPGGGQRRQWLPRGLGTGWLCPSRPGETSHGTEPLETSVCSPTNAADGHPRPAGAAEGLGAGFPVWRGPRAAAGAARPDFTSAARPTPAESPALTQQPGASETGLVPIRTPALPLPRSPWLLLQPLHGCGKSIISWVTRQTEGGKRPGSLASGGQRVGNTLLPSDWAAWDIQTPHPTPTRALSSPCNYTETSRSAACFSEG